MARTNKTKQREPLIKLPWEGGTAYLRLRGEYYHADYTDLAGNRRREKTGKADPADATRELQKMLGRAVRGEEPATAKARGSYTVAKLLDEFIASQIAEKAWDEKVAAGFRAYADRLFIPRWGKLKPAEVTDQMLQDYRTERLRTAVSSGSNKKPGTIPKHAKPRLIQPSTVDREIGFLRMAFRWKHTLDKEVLPDLPSFAARIAGVKAVNKRTGFLTWQEFTSELLPELPFHQRALAVCAMIYGGRKNEWLSLDWSDINFDTRVIHFDDTKSDHPREVQIVPGLMEDELRKLKAHHDLTCPETTAVFTYRGKRFKYIKTAWSKAAGRAGMFNLLFHDTRRSAGAILRDAGLSQEDTMELMGHETPSMFLWYGIKPKDFLDRTGKKVTTHLQTMAKAS